MYTTSLSQRPPCRRLTLDQRPAPEAKPCPAAWHPARSRHRVPKRALSEWDKANPDAIYDPELFRREILPRLRTVKLSAIVEAAGCSKASASDIRRGKWTPHVSTWGALAEVAPDRGG